MFHLPFMTDPSILRPTVKECMFTSNTQNNTNNTVFWSGHPLFHLPFMTDPRILRLTVKKCMFTSNTQNNLQIRQYFGVGILCFTYHS